MQINDNTNNDSVIGFINPKYPEGVTWDSEEGRAYTRAFLDVLQSSTLEVDVIKSKEDDSLTYLLKTVG